MTELTITPMEPEHLAQIAALEIACFSDPWPESILVRELQNPLSLWLCKLYTLDGKPLGHAIPYLRGPGKIHFCCRSCEILITKSWEKMQIASGELSSVTRASMDGQVPAHTSYAEWLARQPYARQEQVLGVTRAQMLRDGKITVPEMFNDAGEYLTLDELRRVDASAFEG